MQPVAIRYSREDGSLCMEAAYAGEMTLWDSIVTLASERSVNAHLWFLPPILHAQRHRRELAHEAHDAISRTLYPAAPNNRIATAGGLTV